MHNLELLIDNHKKWIDTAGRAGVQISLDGIDLHLQTIDPLLLQQGFFSECKFARQSFEDVDFYQSEFYSCDFSNVNFFNCDFRKTTLDYCDFSNSHFKNCIFPRGESFKSNFSNCIFDTCSFVGFNMMECNIDNAKFSNSDFDSAYLDAVSAINTIIINPSNLNSINHICIYTSFDKVLVEGDNAIQSLINSSNPSSK